MRERVAQHVEVRQALLDEVYERHVLGTVSTKGCDAGTFETDDDDQVDDNSDDGEENFNRPRLGPWFRWVRGWIDRATTNSSNSKNSVLLLFYEDIVKDMPKCVETVAAFLSVALTPDDVSEVARRCSREYMAAPGRVQQFQTRWAARALGVGMGDSSPRVRAAQNARGGFKGLEVSRAFDDETRRQMKRAFGYETYEEFKMGCQKLGVGVSPGSGV